MTKRTKVVIVFLLVLGFACALAWQVNAIFSARSYMPMVYYNPDTPVPTATMELPTPAPTFTPMPEYESGEFCAYIWSARKGDEMHVSAQTPGVCYVLEKNHFQDVNGDVLVVFHSRRIKTGTWGCQEGDFGIWPPDDYPCPMPIPPDPFPPDQWGAYKSIDVPYNTKYVCGLCPSFPRPYTCNCVESQ